MTRFISHLPTTNFLATVLGFAASSLLIGAGVAHGDDSVTGAAPPQNFDECVAQSGRISKSDPPRCVSKEGVVFIDNRAALGADGAGSKACRDVCGNGICEEIVCMAVGCPCAESHSTCPKDCR